MGSKSDRPGVAAWISRRAHRSAAWGSDVAGGLSRRRSRNGQDDTEEGGLGTHRQPDRAQPRRGHERRQGHAGYTDNQRRRLAGPAAQSATTRRCPTMHRAGERPDTAGATAATRVGRRGGGVGHRQAQARCAYGRNMEHHERQQDSREAPSRPLHDDCLAGRPNRPSRTCTGGSSNLVRGPCPLSMLIMYSEVVPRTSRQAGGRPVFAG
jgi:hypothetical protein